MRGNNVGKTKQKKKSFNNGNDKRRRNRSRERAHISCDERGRVLQHKKQLKYLQLFENMKTINIISWIFLQYTWNIMAQFKFIHLRSFSPIEERNLALFCVSHNLNK